MKAGADVDAKTNNGMTPLYLAANNEVVDLIEVTAEPACMSCSKDGITGSPESRRRCRCKDSCRVYTASRSSIYETS